MSGRAVPQLQYRDPWTVLDRTGSGQDARLELAHDSGGRCDLTVERCVTGRLENAYPASVHDLEVQIGRLEPAGLLTAALEATVQAIRAADPEARKVVFGAPRGEVGTIAAAEGAGFRFVVDVDLPGAELSLLVSEPGWVTWLDESHDAVPGT